MGDYVIEGDTRGSDYSSFSSFRFLSPFPLIPLDNKSYVIVTKAPALQPLAPEPYNTKP